MKAWKGSGLGPFGVVVLLVREVFFPYRDIHLQDVSRYIYIYYTVTTVYTVTTLYIGLQKYRDDR